MKDQFVTYEIAKRLKELGFDEYCLAFYNDNAEFYYGYSEGEKNSQDSIIAAKDATAPLWQQAIDWIEEKHGIVIELQLDQTSDKKYVIELTKYHGPSDFERLDVPQEIWGYYRDKAKAREVAILKALEFIKPTP